MVKKELFFTLLFILSTCSNSANTNTLIETEVFLEEIGDGEASAKVFTWEDVNQNGIPENGEPPIPYVTTSILYPDILTNLGGQGIPTKFMPGCTENCFENETVYVKTPPGYISTTPTSYSLTGEHSIYFIGFYPEHKDNITSFSNKPEWQKAFINRGA